MDTQAKHGLINRMVGAVRLNVHVFEEVEADASATRQALIVVALVALATGIGSLERIGPSGLIAGIGIAILGWAVWAWIIYFIGSKLLPTHETHADWGQLARALGFAQSPGTLRVFGFVPVIGDSIFLAASLWQLIAMVIAVRQALDYNTTWRAVGVVLLGFIPYLLFMSLALMILT